MKTVRNLKVKLQPGKTPEFTQLFNSEILPLLRQQAGFTHQLAMINGDTALGISVWNDKASAEKYELNVFPKVMEKLTPVLAGKPTVETYDLAVTSF